MNMFVAAAWVFAASTLYLFVGSAIMAARHDQQGDIVTLTLCQIIVFSLTLFAILRVHSPESSIRDFIGLRPTSVAFFPLAAVFGVAATFPAGAILWLITKKFPLGDGASLLEGAYQAASTPKRAIMGVMLCVAGPFVEEMIFRGAIFGPLRSTLSRRGVVVFTGFLFAMVHLRWQYLLPIFLLGTALGLLRTWSGSLVVSVLAHSAFNSVALVSIGAAQSTNDDAPSIPVLVVSTLLTAGSLGLAWFVGTRSDVARQAREHDA